MSHIRIEKFISCPGNKIYFPGELGMLAKSWNDYLPEQ